MVRKSVGLGEGIKVGIEEGDGVGTTVGKKGVEPYISISSIPIPAFVVIMKPVIETLGFRE